MQRTYQREWLAARRAAWIQANGPCAQCGGSDRLEVDHVDPGSKVAHSVWSWSEARRQAELAKCQVLCHRCHVDKCDLEQLSRDPLSWGHGRKSRYNKGCRCDACRAANTACGRNTRKRAQARNAAA